MKMTADKKQNDIDMGLCVGGDFDADALCERIRKRVREKMESGFYDLNEVDWVSKFKPALPGKDETGKHIADALNANWDVLQPIDMGTHRPGLSGKITQLVKKFYQKFVHRFIRFSLARQARFNEAVKTAIEEVYNLRERHIFISHRLANIDERLSALDKTTSGVKKDVADVEENVKSLEIAMRRLSESLRDVDKQGIFLKQSVADALEELSGKPDCAIADVAQAERDKLDSFDYTLFENIHRGSREEIKQRQKVYLDWFAEKKNVLDIGCGRGELLELFKENGVPALGVDINGAMVRDCVKRGLKAVEADAISYLASAAPASFDGISAVQFVEHLPVEVMARFFRNAYDKLEKGGVVAVETINAACLTTFCSAFYLDLSHVKPIHPLALQFLLERIGFDEVKIEYLNPCPDHIRLTPLAESSFSGQPWENLGSEYNQSVMKLNNVLYSHTDYAVVAVK